MMKFVKAFLINDGAVTALEYALIATLIFVVIVGSLTLLSQRAGILYNSVSTALE